MTNVPTVDQLMWPTLKAIKDLGGSASIANILDKIVENEKYPDNIFEPMNSKGRPLFAWRCGWARTRLKSQGVISNKNGVWFLLDKSEHFSEIDIQNRATANNEDEYFSEEDVMAEAWREELIAKILQLEPASFEKLCRVMLLASGYTEVEVTGKSGDGGIDGKGILRQNFVSSRVYFQSKRYKGSVGPDKVRDFRGAVDGRSGDKCLLITTGVYTREAKKEAIRDGARPIDLVDGKEMCDQLKKLNLGVATEIVEKVTINDDFFKGL